MFELVLFVFLLLKTLGCKTGTTPKYSFSANWKFGQAPKNLSEKDGDFLKRRACKVTSQVSKMNSWSPSSS